MIFGKTHFYRCTATFDLVDAGGVLHHPNYLVLLERARIDALACAHYSFFELWKDGYSFAVRGHHSEYFRPIFMGAEVVIFTSILHAKGPRFELIQKIVSADRVKISEGSGFLEGTGPDFLTKDLLHQVKMTLVFITLSPFKPSRLPSRLSTALNIPEI